MTTFRSLLVAMALQLITPAPTGPRAEIVGGAAVPPLGYRLIFEDDFKTLDLWNPSTRRGIWEPGYPQGRRRDPNAHDIEYHVDPRPAGDWSAVQALKPFEIGKHGLAIVARHMPPDLRLSVLNQPFSSGFLNSRHSLAFTFGYVEIRAWLSEGKGLWLAFWLLSPAGVWPPEIDMLEALGGEKDLYWATNHAGPEGHDGKTDHEIVQQSKIAASSQGHGFHDFGFLWTAEKMTWFYDGRSAAVFETPAQLRRSMYFISNLPVGGAWPGRPDDSTAFPARLRIALVRVSQPQEGMR